MGTCVVVEQQAAGAVVWTACAPGFEDRGQAGVDVPLNLDCLPLLERDKVRMTGFVEVDRDHLLGSASRSLDRWVVTWEQSN